MRLEYTILAIDDQPDTAQTFLDSAKSYLRDEGFVLRSLILNDKEAVNTYFVNQTPPRPDLVLVDNRLGEQFDGQDGEHWAGSIRARFRSTDILFYGAAPADDLRTRIAEARVDGVFCATRDQLNDRPRELIAVHIYRWTDPTAMRGLAVSIAADFDELLRRTCIVVAGKQDAETLRKFGEKLLKRSESETKGRAKDFQKLISGGDIEGVLRHPSFGALNLLVALRYLAELMPDGDAQGADQFATEYLQDVIQRRNVLAHGEYDEASESFTLGKLPPFERTPANCRAFRTALGAYSLKLQAIVNAANESGVLRFPEDEGDDE